MSNCICGVLAVKNSFVSVILALIITCGLSMTVYAQPTPDLTSGSVIKLNGFDSFVRVYPNPLLDVQPPMSAELWAYMDDWNRGSTPVRTGIFSHIEHGAGGFEIGLDFGNFKTIGVQAVNCGGRVIEASRSRSNLTTGWHHFVATFDGRFMRFYTDGILSVSTDGGTTCSFSYPYNYELRLGRSARNDGLGSSYFNGRIDEARLYNKVLSTVEITAHFNNGLGVEGQVEPNLLAGWHFDEALGIIVGDYSGNNLYGTIVNDAIWLPRVISNTTVAGINVTNITETGAKINWVTSQSSNSIVEYGLTTSYGTSASSSQMTTEHSVDLNGLAPFTTYNFRVRSTTSGGQTVTSTNQTFTTLDTRPTNNIFYVSPNGKSWANGSKNSPWDLQTALSNTSAIQPGAIIWLRGGVYRVPQVEGSFTSSLTGTAGLPIMVRSYPGEWAVIDGNLFNAPIKNRTVFIINGAHTWFMDLEFTNTDPNGRKIDVAESNPPQRRGNSIDDYGIGTKIINCVIHDTGQGIGAWQQGRDNEYYGNVIFNNGWDAPDRTHGHGVYTQNDNGTKSFGDNIVFNGFALNLRTGGTDSSNVRNYTWRGNVIFNGRMAWQGPNIENLRVYENYTYNNEFKIGTEVNSTYRDAEVSGNYFMSGVLLFEFVNGMNFHHNTVWNSNPTGKNMVVETSQTMASANMQINNNIYYRSFTQFPYWQFYVTSMASPGNPLFRGDFAFNRTTGTQVQTYAYTGRAWKEDLGFDINSTYIDTPLSSNHVVVRPNKFDPKHRAHVIIYNWRNDPTVTVDVSSMLKLGDQYELRNVQDYFNDVISGTYMGGGTITIPMTGRTRARPIGYDQVSSWYHDPLQPNTFPKFGAFVLIKKRRVGRF